MIVGKGEEHDGPYLGIESERVVAGRSDHTRCHHPSNLSAALSNRIVWAHASRSDPRRSCFFFFSFFFFTSCLMVTRPWKKKILSICWWLLRALHFSLFSLFYFVLHQHAKHAPDNQANSRRRSSQTVQFSCLPIFALEIQTKTESVAHDTTDKLCPNSSITWR